MKKVYADSFAQIRKVSGNREMIFFWRNNLRRDDFVKLESGNYCISGEAEYNGLKLKYFIEMKPNVYNSPQGALTRLPIKFIGRNSVKGIRLHIKKNSFPCSYSDRSGDVSMKLTWSGTYKRLSCVNERERNIQKYQKNLLKSR